MRIKIIILFAICFCQISFLSAQSKQYNFLIDTCVTLMKKYALNKDSVNWNIIEQKLHENSTQLVSDSNLKASISFLFKSINDPHGWVDYKQKKYWWQTDLPLVEDSLQKEFDKGVSIKTQLLEKNIGYLRIPPMSKNSRDTEVKDLNDSLCFLLNNQIKGLIIDLRLNEGGDMHPMILGLQQLFPTGKLFTIITTSDSIECILKNNGLYHDSALVLKFEPACMYNAMEIPVVLLTSFETGSSGEIVVIAFKGRSKTLTIGVPTAGLVSGNSIFKITKDATLHLAIGFSKDRTGKIHKTALQPDIYMEAVNKMNDIPKDPKVMKAIQWLTSHIN